MTDNKLLKPHASKRSPSHVRKDRLISNLLSFWQRFMIFLCGKPPVNNLSSDASARPPYYIILLHTVPVAGVAVVVTLNLTGYWVGKELSGSYDQNGPKQLALQLTAKCHELLMLASLSEILLTHLLGRLAFGKGLPFGSLTAATQFKSLSYLWSKDFRALCSAKYPHRALFVSLLIMLTMLGLTVGPSSATALIPRLDDWFAGKALMTLNTTADSLWVSKLVDNMNGTDCGDGGLGCFAPLAWSSMAANFFSYWGHTTLGGSATSPQRISVPGGSSVRNMNIRLKNSLGPGGPDYTVATVQHAVMADMVNSFRFLTYPSRSAKCRTSWSSAMCSYQDVSWFVEAMQPTVFVACRASQEGKSAAFPIMNRGLDQLATIQIPTNASFGDQPGSRFHWTVFENPQLSDASIGAIVKLEKEGTMTDRLIFACTVQAQWADGMTKTTFSGTNYMVEGSPQGFESSILIDKQYKGRTVAVDPTWAQQSVESLLEPQANTTAFDRFLNLGDTENISAKLEAILAILFAERMAHTGSGTIPLSLVSQDLFLKRRGNLTSERIFEASANHSSTFVLGSIMNGYGYGLYTATGVSSSVLLSIIILLTYAAIVIAYLVWLYISKSLYIQGWREAIDVLVLCLSFEKGATGMNSTPSKSEMKLLKHIVTIKDRNGESELVPISGP